MSPEKILIVEDDVKIARFLELELKHEGYSVEQAYDGRDGLEKANHGQYDLMILDVLLPSLNGMEVLRRLRQFSEIPVIMLTAKDEITDKVMGLDLGADDYITKPFSIEELLARIRTSLKRKQVVAEKSNVIIVGNLRIDLHKYLVQYGHETVSLTKREYELLVYLMKNKGIVLSRDTLLEKVWGYDYAGDTNVVDVYIRYLRGKFDDRFRTKLIRSIRGVGYTIDDGFV